MPVRLNEKDFEPSRLFVSVVRRHAYDAADSMRCSRSSEVWGLCKIREPHLFPHKAIKVKADGNVQRSLGEVVSARGEHHRPVLNEGLHQAMFRSACRHWLQLTVDKARPKSISEVGSTEFD